MSFRLYLNYYYLCVLTTVFHLLYLHAGNIMEHSTLHDWRSAIWRQSHRWLWNHQDLSHELQQLKVGSKRRSSETQRTECRTDKRQRKKLKDLLQDHQHEHSWQRKPMQTGLAPKSGVHGSGPGLQLCLSTTPLLLQLEGNHCDKKQRHFTPKLSPV